METLLIIHESLTTASLAQVDKVLYGSDLSLFCCDAGLIRGRGRFNFFPFCFSTSVKNQDIYLSLCLCN